MILFSDVWKNRNTSIISRRFWYHWRAHKDSTAENPESKEYAFIAGGRAVQAHYARVGIDAEVMQTEYKGIYRSKYHLHGEPLISIIIPNKDHTEDLEKCISSIENKSDLQKCRVHCCGEQQ